MINTIEILITDDKKVKTNIETTDGILAMQIHREKNEEQVLIKLSRKDIYKSIKGTWKLNMPNDSRTFEGPAFTDVTSKAIAFINERDNPNTYMLNYF